MTTIGANSESTYDWAHHQWTVPVNPSITQLVKVGEQRLTVKLGYRYYLDAPVNGPEWGLRFEVTFLFPK